MPRRAARPDLPARIEALSPTVDGSAVRVRAGGVSLGRVDPGVPAQLRLRVGDVLDEDRWPVIAAALARRGAYDAGVALLRVRGRSRSALRLALRERFGDEAADDALRRLAPYLDDSAFARSWVQQRLRLRPMGTPALVAELRAQGVPADVARQVVAEVSREAGPDDQRARCAQLARARMARMAGVPAEAATRRLWAFLARRGFTADDIRAALRALAFGEPEP